MAKDYTISISYLEQLADMFSAYTNDLMVLGDYEKVKHYINRLKNNYTSSNPSTSILERLHIDYEKLAFYTPYYPLAKKLTSTKYPSYSFYSPSAYKPLNIDNEQALEIMKDFFKAQGKFFYDQFLEYLSEAEDHLEYVTPNNAMDGEILFLKTIAEAFVSIANYPNICKLTISSHEFTHVIDAFNNPNFHEQLLIREISSMFMEIIASDYLALHLNLGNDNIKRRAYLHGLVKEQAQDIKRKTELLQVYGKHQNESKKRIFAALRNSGFSKKIVEEYERNCLIEDYYYIIAHLVAIELYFIYKEDKDKALSILEDIIMNGTDYNILTILANHNIILTKHLNEYEDNLIKGLKK